MASRALTPGEIILAQRLFKTSINYSLVKIHDEPYTPFQGPRDIVTPNGEIYTTKLIYQMDYSITTARNKANFIHEMVHVWQYQNKVLDPIGAAVSEWFTNGFDTKKSYQYTLDSTYDLTDYKIEQQASIIEDYYWLVILLLPSPRNRIQNKISPHAQKLELADVLKKFLLNPGYARNARFPGKKRRPGPRGKR